jgi:hypothetical protein
MCDDFYHGFAVAAFMFAFEMDKCITDRIVKAAKFLVPSFVKRYYSSVFISSCQESEPRKGLNTETTLPSSSDVSIIRRPGRGYCAYFPVTTSDPKTSYSVPIAEADKNLLADPKNSIYFEYASDGSETFWTRLAECNVRTIRRGEELFLLPVTPSLPESAAMLAAVIFTRGDDGVDVVLQRTVTGLKPDGKEPYILYTMNGWWWPRFIRIATTPVATQSCAT